MKKETLAEYLARGGKITVCPPAGPKTKRTRAKSVKSKNSNDKDINLNLIPENLRISLGFKK